jgi:processive 1,2-diacylglycerol beta-glucosyltransferase
MTSTSAPVRLLAGDVVDHSAMSPALSARAGSHALVITGSYGAGHNRAAAEIADALRTTGLDVDVVDVVDHYPWCSGGLFKRAYFAQLNACPATWSWTLRVLSGRSAFSRAAMRLVRWVLGRLAVSGLASSVRPETQLVVSTHPFASAALAIMRRRGDLGIPAITYLTDASVHALWVHPGIDAHVAVYAEAQRQARALGAARVSLVRPLVPTPLSMAGRHREEVLAAVGVPSGFPVAFVVGGSEGVGDLVTTAREVRRTGLLTPVVICGHNAALRAALDDEPGVVALPWVNRLAELLSAGDLVIHNAGGFTVLESLAAGVPVVSYRPIPGHGHANALALAAEGLAGYAVDESMFGEALAAALRQPRTAPEAWRGRPLLTASLGPLNGLLAPRDAATAPSGSTLVLNAS